MASMLPAPKFQFFTNAGRLAVGYRVHTYLAGTVNTPKVTYQDADQVNPNTNPIILDARGEASIFWDGAYKVRMETAEGALVWEQDDVGSGSVTTANIIEVINDAGGASVIEYDDITIAEMLDTLKVTSMSAFITGTWDGIDDIQVLRFYSTLTGGASFWHHDGTTGGTPTVDTVPTIQAAMLTGRVISADGKGWVLVYRGVRITPYMFGLVGDRIADDTIALQNAMTFADVRGLEFYGGGGNASTNFNPVNTTATVTIPSTLKANFAGLRIEPNASMTSGIAVVVDGNVLGYKSNTIGRIDNLWVRRAFVDDHVDPSSNVDGVAITGDSGQSSYMSFYDLRIEGFRDNLQIGGTGATAYILAFFNPQISCSWRRGVSFTGACENANFHGGFIADSSNELFVGVGIYTAGAGSVDAYFHGTSIDYCDYSVAAAAGVLGFYGCHFENNNDNPHMLLTKTGGRVGCSITMVGGQMTGGPLTNGWASIPAESATGRPGMIDTVGGLHFVSIENTYVGNFRLVETVTQLVRNTDGVANRKLDLRPMVDAGYTGTPSSPLSMSLSTNSIYVGASGSMTGWVNAAGGGSTWSADTVEFYAPDTGSRKMVGGGSSSFLYQIIPVAGRSVVILKAWIKCTAYTGGFATLRAQFYAADATTVVLDVILTQQVSSVGGWIPIWSTIPVPAGAVTMRFNDYTSAFTGTAHFSNEHFWLI